MGVSNKPQDDAKAMKDEYVKGATVSFLADKYNHTEQEVVDVVVNDADVPEPVTQLSEDTKPAESKKDK